MEIVKLNGEDWELYNLKDDPTEIKDLAKENKDKANELVTNYETKKRELEKAAK